MVYGLLVADAAGLDRATALFQDLKTPSHREQLDSWLTTPLDPRRAQVDASFQQWLLMADTEG